MLGDYNFNGTILAFECDLCSGTGKRAEGVKAELNVEHGYYAGPTIKGQCYYCNGKGLIITKEGFELLEFASKFMGANPATHKVTYSRKLKKVEDPKWEGH